MTRLGVIVAVLMAVAAVRAAQDPAAMPVVELETRLTLEVASLKQQLALVTAQAQMCQGQLAPTTYRNTLEAIEPEVARVVAEFERAHPGWTIDRKTSHAVKKGGE